MQYQPNNLWHLENNYLYHFSNIKPLSETTKKMEPWLVGFYFMKRLIEASSKLMWCRSTTLVSDSESSKKDSLAFEIIEIVSLAVCKSVHSVKSVISVFTHHVDYIGKYCVTLWNTIFIVNNRTFCIIRCYVRTNN